MSEILIVLVANYINIACRAFQQMNVVHGNYKAVYPTSQLMAFLEVATYGGVALGVVNEGLFSWHSVALAFALGIGGSLGCMTSMYLHRKVFKREAKS